MAFLCAHTQNVWPHNAENRIPAIFGKGDVCRDGCAASFLFRLFENEAAAGRTVSVPFSSFTSEFKMCLNSFQGF